MAPGWAVAAATDDIRDIRSAKVVPESWSTVLWAIGVFALLSLGALYLWYRHRRAARPRALSLSEQTLLQLEQTRPLMRAQTAREFGIAASEVIRHYIEQRFNVATTQRTTEEFLQSLLHHPHETLASHRSLLAQFLQQCDFVKFAGASLAVADMEVLLQSGRQFVLETGERSAT